VELDWTTGLLAGTASVLSGLPSGLARPGGLAGGGGRGVRWRSVLGSAFGLAQEPEQAVVAGRGSSKREPCGFGDRIRAVFRTHHSTVVSASTTKLEADASRC